MIYTVAVGDTLVKTASISRVEVLDETLDYASIVLHRESSLDTKAMKEVVTITVNDNSEIRSYYFLIDSDVVTPVDKDGLNYARHELSLIELTQRLSDYTVGHRQFTNDSDTLYDVLNDLTMSMFWKDIDEVDPSRTLDVNLSHSSLDILKDIQARDFQFNNHTYREAVDTIFNEVGGVPRIIFENGIFKLTIDKLNERKTIRTLLAENENNYKQTHNMAKYATVSESYVDNQVFDKSLIGASIVEPSSESFMVVTTDSAVFDSSNSVWKTRYPIREIVKFELEVLDLAGAVDVLDITPRVVHEDVFQGLEITNFFNVDYSPGSALILKVEPIEGTINPSTLEVYTAGTKQGSLYFKDNVIQNLYTIYGGTWGDEVIKSVIDSGFYDKYDATADDHYRPYASPDSTNNSIFYNLRARITYIPIFDSALQVERANTGDINRYTTMQSNQSASTVSTEKALKKMEIELNALGNKEIMTTKRLTLLTDEFEVGDYTSDDFILTKKEVSYFKDHFDIRYEFDKDFQKRNEDVQVSSELRLTAIPKQVSDRKLVYKEYAYVGFPNLTSETTLLGFDGREIFTNIFEKSVTFNTSIQNALVTNEAVLTTATPLLLPVISSGGGNVLNFNFGFQSPNVAGTQLDTVTQSIPTLVPIEYTDANGELDNLNWELVDKVTVTDEKTLPLTPRTDANKQIVGSIFKRYIVKKDAADTIDMAYQLHMIPNSNIVIGDYFASRNNLIETKSAFDDLVVYSSAEFYTPSESKRVKGTATALTVTRFSNELIQISANVNNAAWAIGTSTGELIVAVNQYTTLTDEIDINYFNSRFDIDYTFLDDVSIIKPNNPTNLTISNSIPTTLFLSWDDNSTNETYFLIEISEDDITYSFLDTVGVDETTYRATNLDSATLYYFKVYSYNQAGTNGVSANGSGTTAVVATIPGTPDGFLVTAQDSDKLTGSWTASSSGDPEDNFEVGIKLAVLSDIPANWTTDTTTNESYQWTGLSASTSYHTRVRACNASGCSSYATYTKSTDAPAPTPSATPTITNVSYDYDSVNFDVVNNDASTVTIKADWTIGPTGDSTPDRTTVAGVVTSTNITYSLSASTQYTLTATAQASGESESSHDSYTFTTPATPVPPDAPTSFTATNASGGISYGWNNVLNETGYVIEIHTNSGFTALFDTINKGANVTTHLEAPMLSGTYWSRIKATNANGSSDFYESPDNPVSV